MVETAAPQAEKIATLGEFFEILDLKTRKYWTEIMYLKTIEIV